MNNEYRFTKITGSACQVLILAMDLGLDAISGEEDGCLFVCVTYINEVFMVSEVEVVHYSLCVELSESRQVLNTISISTHHLQRDGKKHIEVFYNNNNINIVVVITTIDV